jgi:hypothetical protein
MEGFCMYIYKCIVYKRRKGTDIFGVALPGFGLDAVDFCHGNSFVFLSAPDCRYSVPSVSFDSRSIALDSRRINVDSLRIDGDSRRVKRDSWRVTFDVLKRFRYFASVFVELMIVYCDFHKVAGYAWKLLNCSLFLEGNVRGIFEKKQDGAGHNCSEEFDCFSSLAGNDGEK